MSSHKENVFLRGDMAAVLGFSKSSHGKCPYRELLVANTRICQRDRTVGGKFIMKATGVVRRIDDLGRIVIPKEIRRTMRIREGDPLEIFTDKDGGVVFKKYSLMGGVADFAGQMCETLAKLSGLVAVITDRDNTLAVSGAPKRELADRSVSEDLERLMENRQLYVRQGEDAPLQVCRDVEKYHITVCAPILSGGDVLGAVLFVSDEPRTVNETETKMIQTAAGFLSRHMEN